MVLMWGEAVEQRAAGSRQREGELRAPRLHLQRGRARFGYPAPRPPGTTPAPLGPAVCVELVVIAKAGKARPWEQLRDSVSPSEAIRGTLPPPARGGRRWPSGCQAGGCGGFLFLQAPAGIVPHSEGGRASSCTCPEHLLGRKSPWQLCRLLHRCSTRDRGLFLCLPPPSLDVPRATGAPGARRLEEEEEGFAATKAFCPSVSPPCWVGGDAILL